MQLQPGNQKQSLLAPLKKEANRASHLVFRRDTSDHQQAKVTAAKAHISLASPGGGNVCIDTVKRDKQIIKVVPTSALPDAPTSAPHHVELVRSDEKRQLWNQIIYNDRGEPIDVTHLSLSSNMSFWRAEYLCASCQPGHQKHTVLYENVEIEVDEMDAHATPKVVCEGQGKSSEVQKKDKQDEGKYGGVVFSIDRVALGMWDSQGHGGVTTYTEGKRQPVAGGLPTEPGVQLPGPKDSKKTQPISVNKREVEVKDDGFVF